MTKLTFANKNVIVVEGYKIGDALPAKAPNLKKAAIMALKEIEGKITPDCPLLSEELKGKFKEIFFTNGAILTVPIGYSPQSYYEALKIVVQEIAD